MLDDEGRTALWERFASTPEPLGHDPSITPPWTSPTADAFAGLHLTPWRLRVLPGEMLNAGQPALTWRAPEEP